ncbi:hypothetical protein HGG72_25420 [Ochrobactrum pecoris]|nr:hypothetical protein [Brucella pecoris]
MNLDRSFFLPRARPIISKRQFGHDQRRLEQLAAKQPQQTALQTPKMPLFLNHRRL